MKVYPSEECRLARPEMRHEAKVQGWSDAAALAQRCEITVLGRPISLCKCTPRSGCARRK